MTYSKISFNTASKMLVNANKIGAGVRAGTILCALGDVDIECTSNNLKTQCIK